MAQEAKVRVQVDTTQAKREMDEVNRRMETTKKRGAALAGSVRNIARGAATGVAAVGAAAELASPGFLRATGGALLGTARAGWRSLLPEGATGGMDMFTAEMNAQQQAVQQVQDMVSGGGDISDQRIRTLIEEMTAVNRPGAQNVQQVERVRDQMLGDAGARAFEGVAADFRRIVDDFGNWVRMLSGGG